MTRRRLIAGHHVGGHRQRSLSVARASTLRRLLHRNLERSDRLHHLQAIMTRRTRTFAGLLALAAMTASFSEAVLASVCASPTAMGSMSGMVPSPAEDDSQDTNERGMPCDRMDHTGESREGGEHCPLTPTATQGCTVAASAPAPETAVGGLEGPTTRHVIPDVIEPELLLAHALYHPPRA